MHSMRKPGQCHANLSKSEACIQQSAGLASSSLELLHSEGAVWQRALRSMASPWMHAGSNLGRPALLVISADRQHTSGQLSLR